MIARWEGVRSPERSSAMTIGDNTSVPSVSAFMTAGILAPARTSIQTELSTITSTQLVDVDVQVHFPLQLLELREYPLPTPLSHILRKGPKLFGRKRSELSRRRF